MQSIEPSSQVNLSPSVNPQLSDERIGKRIGEMLLAGICGQVHDGQNSNGSPGGVRTDRPVQFRDEELLEVITSAHNIPGEVARERVTVLRTLRQAPLDDPSHRRRYRAVQLGQRHGFVANDR